MRKIKKIHPLLVIAAKKAIKMAAPRKPWSLPHEAGRSPATRN